jgi:hypothetical protein
MGLSLDDRRNFFSVQGIESCEILVSVKRILAKCLQKGIDLRSFQRELKGAFGKTLALSPEVVEKVFRGNVNRAYIDGLLRTIEHPIVASGFPYLEFSATHDDRTPDTHLALEHLGLDGTAIYRRDDPFWRRFMPPLTDLCRCTVIPLSLEQAAEKGVKEAQESLRSGEPPKQPEWVISPPFDPRLDLEDEWSEEEDSPGTKLPTALSAYLVYPTKVKSWTTEP